MNYDEEMTLDGGTRSTDSMTDAEAFALAVGELATAKSQEQAATARRIDAEGRVLRFISACEEGSKTVRIGTWKVTATFGINRTVDRAAMEAVRSEMAPALFEQAVEYRPNLVLAGLRYLRSNEPDAYAVLAQAITAKPAKPSVRIEAINEED